jgi:alkylhydroperoxidase family enzyme
MTRINPAVPLAEDELAELDPAKRVELKLGGIWAHRPEAAEAWAAFRATLVETGSLSPRLVELVRLRIAFHNQCRTCMAARLEPELVSEDDVCSLERPQEAADLDDRERAALRFAELFATDHLRIDDAVLDDLRRVFSEGEIVELGIHCARMVGFGRLAATFGVYEDLPARFQGPPGEQCTPWGGEVLAGSPVG